MYYLFRGLGGESGEPVIGRLAARNEEAVHQALEARAIVAEAVHPEKDGGLFPPTLQAALDEIGVRITFNQMPKVHHGGGVWILDRGTFPRRVMQLAHEASGGAPDRQAALRRIQRLLESLYGDKPPAHGSATAGAAAGTAGRFASADEVRAEMNRLKTAIKSLERELISMKSRPFAEREPRPSGTKKPRADRTRDDVLREIFEHNLQLMTLTRELGITGLTDQ